MLIRWATWEDKAAWLALSQEYDKYISEMTSDMALWYDGYDGFDNYMNEKIKKNNAVMAVDRMTNHCNGMIAFSKTHNRITFFAVSEKADFNETADKLLLVALRQLNTNKDITVQLPVGINTIFRKIISVFERNGFSVISDDIMAGVKAHNLVRKATNEQRGKSFHYNYDDYLKGSQKEFCLFCNDHPAPEGQFEIAKLNYSIAYIERIAQGRLFGKGYVISKLHVVDFEEMPKEDMAGFMSDIQSVAKALHKITGAIKINYEIHANTGPHLHCHLFPRYLDDDFPGVSINYQLIEPSPYESDEEFMWFIEQLRKELLTQ